jgi:hypothetical protein
MGSNPAGKWTFVCCECCVLSGRGLCDGLITRPEESYLQWCVAVCDLATSWMRMTWLALGSNATEGKKSIGRSRSRILFLLETNLCLRYMYHWRRWWRWWKPIRWSGLAEGNRKALYTSPLDLTSSSGFVLERWALKLVSTKKILPPLFPIIESRLCYF